MYEVSTAYKNYIENNLERDYKVKLTVGTDVIDSNDIFSYSIETSQPSDKFTIGNSISQVLKIEIKNQEKPFYNNQLYLQVGMLVNGVYEYVPIGYFNVDKSEKKDHRTTITAYDNMYKLEGLYVCELGSSKTISSIMSDIASKTGVQFAEFSYNNYSIPEDIVGYSYREVVAMMAGLNGGNAYIDREGKIKFIYLSSNASKWSINDFYLFDGNSFKEQSYTIDKVTCYKDKDTSWSNGNLGTTAMTIEYENPFMTEVIAKDIYNKLANIEYQAFNMETMSYLALDVGDWISYTSQSNTVYSLCIQHYKFSGGIKQTLEAKTDGNKSNFNASGSLTQKVNRTITDLLAAKRAIINKANIDDLVAGKITVSTLNGGTATLQEIMTSFISGSAGQFLHLTGQNVVIDEAVIRYLIASKIKVSDLKSSSIETNKFNIVSKDGGISIVGSTQQFKDKNGKVRLQIGKDAEGNFTFVLVGTDGTTAILNENGITKDAIPEKVIVNDMVADNANISGYKLNIDSVINEINNNGTETFKSSVVKLDDTGQTLDVAFKELSTVVDNFDADNKNLAFYNTDYWEQGGINNSGETFESNQYLRTNNYINLSPGKYTITKYSSDFNIQLYLYEESTFKKVIAPGTFELLNNSSVKLVVCKEPISKIELSELVLFKFKLESGEVSTEFSYNPLDVGYLAHALQTGFDIQQGQIAQLVKDTTITTSSGTKTLKDAYNETKSTVDSTVQTVSKQETELFGVDGNGGLKQKVSSVELKTTDEAFTVQVQKNQNKQYTVRYIRDYIAGSNESSNNYWSEIQVITNEGNNIALNKSVTCSNSSAQNLSNVCNGNVSESDFAYCDHSENTEDYIQIYLGGVYRTIDEIKIWHKGWTSNRVYNRTKTQVSEDGVNWITLFDSSVSGTYAETVYGHSIKVNGTSFNSSKVTINELGLHVLNGAIDISNKAGNKVLEADTDGNLKFAGIVEQRDPVTGYISTSLKYNGLGIYDWRLKNDLVGGIVATQMTVSKRGTTTLFADKGNILSIGYRDGDGTEEDFSHSQFTPVMLIDDAAKEEPGYVTSFYKSMAFFNSPAFLNDIRVLDYSGLCLYGNDHSVPITTLANGYINNDVYLMAYKAGGGSVNLGARDSDAFYSYMNCNSGGITVYGNIACTGTKLRAVKTKNFGIVGQNAYETAEPYFGDLMFAKTNSEGYCVIPFDDKFKETVNTKCRYHVMCSSAYGENNDVFPVLKCIEQTENYFIIKSNVPNTEFSVEVKCRQVGYEADRLEVQDIKINNQESDYSELENNYKNTQNDTIYLDKIYNDDFLE